MGLPVRWSRRERGEPGARCGIERNSLTSDTVTGESASTLWAVAVLLVVVAAVCWWIWQKGRPFAAGDVFRASRTSTGNHLFPTQVLITSTSVVQYTPR